MKLSKAIRDKEVKSLKKLLLNRTHKVEWCFNSNELKNSVFKITNIRKYKTEGYRTDENHTYEFDVIVDMRHDNWYWSTCYNKRHAKTANRIYRRTIQNTINEEVKYMGIAPDDFVVVEKIVWDYLED